MTNLQRAAPIWTPEDTATLVLEANRYAAAMTVPNEFDRIQAILKEVNL